VIVQDRLGRSYRRSAAWRLAGGLSPRRANFLHYSSGEIHRSSIRAPVWRLGWRGGSQGQCVPLLQAARPAPRDGAAVPRGSAACSYRRHGRLPGAALPAPNRWCDRLPGTARLPPTRGAIGSQGWPITSYGRCDRLPGVVQTFLLALLSVRREMELVGIATAAWEPLRDRNPC
jgi:hypothetical protein